jgi:glucose/mannose-6-phosphate isomerase
VLVCGMGGSGITGDFAAAVTGRPLLVHKGYGLPAWAADRRPLVLAISYSGNTEETLSAVAQARARGLAIVAVTGGGELEQSARKHGEPVVTVPGGLQPRAALGYLLGAALGVLGAAGMPTAGPEALTEAAALLDSLVAPSSAARSLAADLAEGMADRIALIYGSTGLVAPAAQRWKTQINENAKWPAWWSLLPELDHNEIMGWTSLGGVTKQRVGIVALRDRDEPPGVALRFRHTASIIAGGVGWVGEVNSQGEHELARLLSLAVVGDLFSLELARLAGVDPVPVAEIESLKQRLAEESGRDQVKGAS